MPKSDQRIDKNRYLVSPRTLIFLFDDQNRVLLIKGAKNKTRWPGLYNGIGGHIEAGEDIYSAAYRELKEESGVSDTNLHFCGQVTVNVSKQVGVMIFVFKGDYSKNVFSHSVEGTFSWVPVDEIKTKPVVEDLPYLIPRIAAYKPGSPIIVGIYAYDKNEKLTVTFL